MFADAEGSPRQQIVDGQQRLTTTAVLLTAIRDMLRDFKKDRAAQHIDETYLRGFDLETEEHVERIVLNPEDQKVYDSLLARGELPAAGSSALADAYRQVVDHLKGAAPSADDYKVLISITTQLENDVQVLVAVASGLAEAYVIFETLNDRGADLTTADLLKNYLFSQAGQNFAYIQSVWTRISDDFDKSEEFVRMIRYDFMSRHGHVTARKLYKAAQDDIGSGAAAAKEYIERLDGARKVYLALRDVDNTLWDALEFDTRESVLALRRFGLESSYPLTLAIFERWKGDPERAARLFVKVTNWSIRALIAGRLGGSVAEKAFSSAAKQVSDGNLKTQDDVRGALDNLVVDDAEFAKAFARYGNVTTPRARYLLAMLERARRQSEGLSLEGLPDWASRTVTIEHIMARAEAKGDEDKLGVVETLGNMSLLEKSLNKGLEDKAFVDKVDVYAKSAFVLTSPLGNLDDWNIASIEERMVLLSGLAPLAWPL